MDRLTGSDFMMLAAEKPDTPMHMAGVGVFDPSDVPDFGFEKFRSFACERMSLVPRLRQRLQEVPFGLDYPILVDDPDFDPMSHVHRVALPAPGGQRELAEVVTQLLPIPLDRRRPLWDIWYIEGLEGGRVATMMKIHHALFDGVTSMAMIRALYDMEPEPAGPPRVGGDESVEPARSSVELFVRGAGRLATTPLRAGRLAVQSARQIATLVRYRGHEDAPPLVPRPPATPWNARTGPRRGWAFGSLPLSELKGLRKSLRVTVNDAVCAVAGGALRAYLLDEGELPDVPLVAIVPASPRLGEDSGVGNVITGMVLSLGTDIEDPIERILSIHKAAAIGKERALAARAHHVTGISDLVPPVVTSLLVKAVGNRPVFGRIANTIVTNTPGSPEPFYCAGARMEAMHPLGMVGGGGGLSLFVSSYLDRLEFGVVTDADLLPDAWNMVDYIYAAFEKLREAVQRRSDEGIAAEPQAGPTTTAAA